MFYDVASEIVMTTESGKRHLHFQGILVTPLQHVGTATHTNVEHVGIATQPNVSKQRSNAWEDLVSVCVWAAHVHAIQDS